MGKKYTIGPFKGSVSRHGEAQRLVVIVKEFHKVANKHLDKKYNVKIILEELD